MVGQSVVAGRDVPGRRHGEVCPEKQQVIAEWEAAQFGAGWRKGDALDPG